MTMRRERAGADLCAAPFTQLFVRPDGKIAPCCWLYNHELGDIRNQTLADVWNGEKLKGLRREFIEGDPKTCRGNMQELSCHRGFENLMPLVELKEELPPPAKRLHLVLNGKCNLECIMCEFWKMPNGVNGAHGFWEEGAREIFPYLKELEVMGGEPFVQRDTYRLIGEVSRVNPACRWMFTTNGHYLFNSTVTDALDKIRLRSIMISIDSLVPEVFAKIRLGGRLAVVLAALEEMLRYRDRQTGEKKFTMIGSLVVQKDNYRELPDFIRFCRERDMAPLCAPVSNSPALSIFEFPAARRVEIADYYSDCFEKRGDTAILRILRPLIDSLPAKERLDRGAALMRALSPKA